MLWFAVIVIIVPALLWQLRRTDFAKAASLIISTIIGTIGIWFLLEYANYKPPAALAPGCVTHWSRERGYTCDLPPAPTPLKFVDLVPCTDPKAGVQCCPVNYVWDLQNNSCRLGSSFKADPDPGPVPDDAYERGLEYLHHAEKLHQASFVPAIASPPVHAIEVTQPPGLPNDINAKKSITEPSIKQEVVHHKRRHVVRPPVTAPAPPEPDLRTAGNPPWHNDWPFGQETHK